jgi:hypothetical protein
MVVVVVVVVEVAVATTVVVLIFRHMEEFHLFSSIPIYFHKFMDMNNLLKSVKPQMAILMVRGGTDCASCSNCIPQ